MSDKFEIRRDYDQAASRSEAVFRIPYGLVLAMIGGLWGIVAELVMILQWLHVLVTGRRNYVLWRFTANFLNFFASYWAYISSLTDIRPLSQQSKNTT